MDYWLHHGSTSKNSRKLACPIVLYPVHGDTANPDSCQVFLPTFFMVSPLKKPDSFLAASKQMSAASTGDRRAESALTGGVQVSLRWKKSAWIFRYGRQRDGAINSD